MTSVYCLFETIVDEGDEFQLLVAIFREQQDAINEKKKKEESGTKTYTIQFWNVQ